MCVCLCLLRYCGLSLQHGSVILVCVEGELCVFVTDFIDRMLDRPPHPFDEIDPFLSFLPLPLIPST